MELLLILVIVLIIFGAGKLPQLGEEIGKAIKGFKKSVYEPEPVERASTPQASLRRAHPRCRKPTPLKRRYHRGLQKLPHRDHRSDKSKELCRDRNQPEFGDENETSASRAEQGPWGCLV
jgi:sec-independent protein translocase protein TatA